MPPAPALAPIVVLGSGLAGVSLIRELRKLDRATPVTLISADEGAFYSKPNLSNALAAGRTPAQLVVTPPATLAGQLGATLRAEVRVTALRPAEHVLQTSAGPIEYGRLVLAVGAQPIRLPIEGSGAAEVLSVNNLADYACFRERLAGRRRVAILGAGLIGCEFANDLAATGHEVQVFDLSSQPLGRLLPAGAAAFFRRGLESAGVVFRFETSIGRVDRAGAGFVLLEMKGGEFVADLVLSAVGLRPETALARDAGLKVGRGILVDEMLASSDADIFAVGDCAEVRGNVLPFVLPIMQQARALSRTLAGTPTPVSYPAMPVVVKTPACPAVVCPPPPNTDGVWREECGPRGVQAIYEDRAGKPAGFALVGDAVKEKQALAAGMPALL